MKSKSPSLPELKFLEPMYARLVNELPEGKGWLYEVKFDGYRCLAGRDSTGVTLWSRRGNLSQTNSRTSSSPNGRRIGHLRHSKFVGMRDDKDAREVGRED